MRLVSLIILGLEPRASSSGDSQDTEYAAVPGRVVVYREVYPGWCTRGEVYPGCTTHHATQGVLPTMLPGWYVPPAVPGWYVLPAVPGWCIGPPSCYPGGVYASFLLPG